jgi:uncharacterized protein with LGFP repeats
MSAIDDKYAALGGPGGFLGPPADEGAGSQEMETRNGVGRTRDFQNGSIYWKPGVGAFSIHGGIRLKWVGLSAEEGFLGFPVTDETGTPDGRGRFNHFEGGSIYWTPQTAARSVHGAIRDKWASMGWERSSLGYPVSDERDFENGRGRQSSFEGGAIIWTPQGVRVQQRIDDSD